MVKIKIIPHKSDYIDDAREFTSAMGCKHQGFFVNEQGTIGIGNGRQYKIISKIEVPFSYRERISRAWRGIKTLVFSGEKS
jgi:hypothetical protein